MRLPFMQFVKFGLVGISNTVISYVTYALLVYLGVHYLFANGVAFVVSVLNSFYWNNKYVFTASSGEKRNLWWTLAKTFVSYSFTGLFLNSFLLKLFIGGWGISPYLGPILCLVISIPVNFLINKYWAFRTKKEASHATEGF